MPEKSKLNGRSETNSVREALSAAKPPEKIEKQLTFRNLDVDTGFGETINCLPGQVIIVEDSDVEGLGIFLDVLRGHQKGSSFDIRYGDETLHSSEIFLANSSDYLWREKSVESILKIVGVPASEISDYLDRLGLVEKANFSPSALTSSERKRLQFVGGVYSKAKVVLFESPFHGVESEWLPPMTELLVQRSKLTEQIFLLSGLGKIIALLIKSDDFKVLKIKKERTRRISLSGSSESKGIVEQVRETARKEIFASTEKEIITRPQSIVRPPARVAHPERTEKEAIKNPKYEDFAPSVYDSSQTNINQVGSEVIANPGNESKVGEMPQQNGNDYAVDAENPHRRKRKDSLTRVDEVERFTKQINSIRSKTP